LFAQGFSFGTIIIVIMIAKIHFEVESRLKVKPFFEHWITVIKLLLRILYRKV